MAAPSGSADSATSVGSPWCRPPRGRELRPTPGICFRSSCSLQSCAVLLDRVSLVPLRFWTDIGNGVSRSACTPPHAARDAQGVRLMWVYMSRRGRRIRPALRVRTGRQVTPTAAAGQRSDWVQRRRSPRTGDRSRGRAVVSRRRPVTGHRPRTVSEPGQPLRTSSTCRTRSRARVRGGSQPVPDKCSRRSDGYSSAGPRRGWRRAGWWLSGRHARSRSACSEADT